MKTMKKGIALVLALMMCVGLMGVSIWAEGTETYQIGDHSYTMTAEMKNSIVLRNDQTAIKEITVFTAEDFVTMSQMEADGVISFGEDNGATIKLGADINLSGFDYTPLGQMFQIFDGQNHKVSGLSKSLYGYCGGGAVRNLEISNSTISAQTAGIIAGSLEGVEISNVTISGTNSIEYDPDGFNCYSGNHAGIGILCGLVADESNISNVTVTGSYVLKYNDLVFKYSNYTLNDNQITQLFGADYNGGSSTEANLAKINVSGASITVVEPDPVATIGDVGYRSLKDARNAARDADNNAEIVLLQDIDDAPFLLINKSMRLNLNGHRISAASSFMIVDDATLTIDGTTTGSAVEGRIFVGYSSNYSTVGDGNLVINGGTYSDQNDCVISTNGMMNNSDVTISNASLSAPNNTVMYLAGGGTHQLTNCTITGKNGIEVKAGNLSINGSSTEVTASADATGHDVNNNGTSTSGYAIALVENSAYHQPRSATIGAGVFSGPIGIVDDDEDSENNAYSFSITGGEFSTNPIDYVSNGYAVFDYNGKYVVSKNAGTPSAPSGMNTFLGWLNGDSYADLPWTNGAAPVLLTPSWAYYAPYVPSTPTTQPEETVDIGEDEVPLADLPEGVNQTLDVSKVTVEVDGVETPLAEVQVPFADVENAGWEHDAIAYVQATELMTGTDTASFSPATESTRGMVATILYRLADGQSTSAASFADVGDTYYAEAAAWSKENGVFSGDENGNFNGGTAITREQLVSVLYRYAVKNGYDVSGAANLSTYADGANVSEYAAAAMAWAIKAGLIQGDNGLLNPTATATRVQLAAILMRFCENVVK